MPTLGPTLRELIELSRDSRSYATLSRDGGGTPSLQRWQQLADPGLAMKTFPEMPAIRGIATALRVSEYAVVQAAARSLGVGVSSPEPRLASLLPPEVEQFSDAQIIVVLDVVKSLIAANKAVVSR